MSVSRLEKDGMQRRGTSKYAKQWCFVGKWPIHFFSVIVGGRRTQHMCTLGAWRKERQVATSLEVREHACGVSSSFHSGRF